MFVGLILYFMFSWFILFDFNLLELMFIMFMFVWFIYVHVCFLLCLYLFYLLNNLRKRLVHLETILNLQRRRCDLFMFVCFCKFIHVCFANSSCLFFFVLILFVSNKDMLSSLNRFRDLGEKSFEQIFQNSFLHFFLFSIHFFFFFFRSFFFSMFQNIPTKGVWSCKNEPLCMFVKCIFPFISPETNLFFFCFKKQGKLFI